MISNLPSYIQRLAVYKYVAIRSNIYLSRIDKLFHLLSLIMWSSNFCLHDGTLYRSLYFFCNFLQYNNTTCNITSTHVRKPTNMNCLAKHRNKYCR